MNRRLLLAMGMMVALAVPAVSLPAQDTARAAVEHRHELERRLTARIGVVVREQLGLSADQARRLQEVDRRYQPERRRLMQQEMELRRGLRQQIAAGESADQRATAVLLDRLAALQRERLELQTGEQRELAAFLTPLQRAKLLGLQADLHRRVILMRRGRADGHRAHPPGAGPEGRPMLRLPGEGRRRMAPP